MIRSSPEEHRQDESTRYLCAAAHLDSEFADEAIREFLTVPTRAIAPSPGIDSAAVLREAVAARHRRRLRDGALAVLVLGFLFVSPYLVLAWTLIAALFCVAKIARNVKAGGSAAIGRLIAEAGAGVAVAVVVTGVASYLTEGANLIEVTDVLEDPWLLPIALGLGLAVLLVLAVDRYAVWQLTTVSFRREHFAGRRGEDRWPREWWVRTLGLERYRRELREVEQASRATPNGTETIVYRESRPFVGSGITYQPWSLVLALDPVDDGEADRVGDVDLGDLYAELADGMAELGASTSLSPSHRLSGLTTSERVVISAEDLVTRINDPRTTTLLPDPEDRPVRELPATAIAEVVRRPQEWMRYFRCFNLETWDRAMVFTWHLHLGHADRHLYVEWTPSVLLPISEEYRTIDQAPGTAFRPVREAAARALRLPVTITGRLLHALVPLRVRSDGRPTPDKYGAAYSLRELGAGDDVRDYFQRTDLERYTKLVDRQLLRSIGRYLEERGITTTEFMRQASEVVNKHVHIEGSVTGNVFIGDRNKVGNVTKRDDKDKD